jgi:hypothetical protein
VSALKLGMVFAVAFAFPTALLLATVRTVACWIIGILALTAAAIWLPVAFALSQGSTRGLAFLVPVIYGLPAAAVLAVVDRSLRSPSLDPVRPAR